MKNYIVTYTDDNGRTEHAETVTAADYTKAYLQVIFNNPIYIIITSLKEI